MNTGVAFEEYVRDIYLMLLNLKDEGIVVSRDATIRGKSDEDYQIDVYYEFLRANVRHRVIIECKDWKHPVKRETINALESKIRDIPGVIGVIISRNGYQSGAKQFAEYQGILALIPDELPSLSSLIAERLATVLLPDESCIGEPFWTVMEMRDGQNTGSYLPIHPHDLGRKPFISLFFSKYHAQLFLHQAKQLNGTDISNLAVRGLPRHILRAFIIQLEVFEIRHELFEMPSSGALLMFLPPDSRQTDRFAMIPINREQLMNEYFGEQIPSIRETKL
ncbi:restriction endonuclease [Leptolyngbya sp. AN03gr2]|uniref:restriction endonuclease n=1 Tax=unclassified Leptolyngbya TaxID=2650499 RepID=UPI003D31BD9B